MKATGVVRRIDELGRVVVPMEIRRTLRIRGGDPLELFVDKGGMLLLRKYSPISELGDFAKEYAEALYDSLGNPILICDRDMYITTAGCSKQKYMDKEVSDTVKEMMENRKSILNIHKESISLIDGTEEEVKSYVASPIIANGDAVGNIVMFSKKAKVGAVELKALETAARFIGRQLEQ